MIQIWKTGFYDSLNEKIVGTDQSPSQRKVHYQNKNEQITTGYLTETSIKPDHETILPTPHYNTRELIHNDQRDD